MSNLGILLKNNFNMLVGRLQRKNRRRSTESATILLIVGAIVIVALYAFEAWSMFEGLKILDNGKVCMFHACTTTFSVLLILGLMRSSGGKITNDNDLLLSLPIKKRDIVISKTVSKFLFDFFFILMLFVPYLVIYQIQVKFDLQILLIGTLMALILPLFSIGLTYIFDFIVSKFFNKLKLGGLFKSIFLVLVFILILGLMMIKTSTYGILIDQVGNSSIDSIDSIFINYYNERPLTNVLLKFMFEPNIVNVLLFFAMIIVPFLIGMCLYAMNFGKTFNAYKSKSRTLKFSKPRSPFVLLLKKELYNYANTTAYIVNTIIGSVLILAFGVFLAITGKSGIANLLGYEMPNEFVVAIIALIFCGLSTTITISSCSISLEGKCFYSLKSLPINLKDVFLSKACLHLIMAEPFLIISSILIWIFMKLTALEFLLMLVIPTLHILIISFGGLFINLCNPNFEWEDETKVVKQSLSVLLSMVLGAVLVAIPIVILKKVSGLTMLDVELITIAFYSVVLTAFIVALFKKGKNIFYKL